MRANILHAYADETEFEHGTEKHVGAAVFLTRTSIKSEVIENAFGRLRSLLEGASASTIATSQKTLNRGYFHASEDGFLAKECLAASIAKYCNGQLEYAFANQTVIQNHTSLRSRMSDTNRQAQMIGFSLAGAVATFNQPILLSIEAGRARSPERGLWWENIWCIRERRAYENPAIPVTFPIIKVEPVGKGEPGAQVVDLLLWSIQRQFKNVGDDQWPQLCGLELVLSTVPESGAWLHYGSFALNDEIGFGSSYPDAVLAQWKKDMATGIQNIWSALVTMEGTLMTLADSGPLPSHVAHFQDELDNVAKNLSKGLNSHCAQLLQRAGSLFIRLFDTLPVWQGLSSEDLKNWQAYLNAKTLVGLALRKDLLHGVETWKAMSRMRSNALKSIAVSGA